MMAATLRKHGFEVLQGSNGKEGVGLARSHRPDLILSDVHMPETDGQTFLEALRKEPVTATIPVILITGEPNEADARQAKECGVAEYLTKPIPVPDLLAAINTHIRKQ